jgi:hypothetical protein
MTKEMKDEYDMNKPGSRYSLGPMGIGLTSDDDFLLRAFQITVTKAA